MSIAISYAAASDLEYVCRQLARHGYTGTRAGGGVAPAVLVRGRSGAIGAVEVGGVVHIDGERLAIHNPDDDPMPVFVIKAKDKLAVKAVMAYRELCQDVGLAHQADEVLKAADEIDQWQGRNWDDVKLPDHDHVPATHRQRVKAAKLAGLASAAGAGVCQCPGVEGVHVAGVGGCSG